MKKEGMTIIESVVIIALLGIVFLLVTPLIRGFGKVNTRVKTQKEIDREFSNVNEFIQQRIKAAKRTDKETPFSLSDKDDFHDQLKYASIYYKFYNSANELFVDTNRVPEGGLGNVLVLEIPFQEETGEDKDGDEESLESQFEILAFQDGALKYKIIDYVDGTFGNFETLMDSIEVYSGPDIPSAPSDIDDQLKKSSFKFNEGITLYYINLTIGDNSEGKFRDSLKGSASSRIDIQ